MVCNVMEPKAHLTHGSLFTGIGGFDAGFEAAGIRSVWQVEIDQACRGVLARHFPDTQRFADVREVGAHNLPPVDIITFGAPCQDVSIAGKRAGLKGERSGLFFEAIRICRELQPAIAIYENVPGILSASEGKDIQIVIDSLTQIGYTMDVDILDAQEFGVAQRRRRVFFVCVRLDVLLQRKTDLSKRILADLLTQTLRNTWGAIPQASSLAPLHSDCERPAELCGGSLRRMIALFATTQEKLAWKKLDDCLCAALVQFMVEGSNSEPPLILNTEKQSLISVATDICAFLSLILMGTDDGFTSTSMSWNNIVERECLHQKSFTTSTATRQITESKICMFAQTTLTTLELIHRSLNWSSECWSVRSSALTLLQESMSYARQAINNLLIETELRNNWRDYLHKASGLAQRIERDSTTERAGEILFECEGVCGDIAESEEERAIAASLSATGVGTCGADDNQAQAGHIIANALNAKSTGRYDASVETLVTHALTGEGHDASEDGTGRGTPLVTAAPLTGNAYADRASEENNLVISCPHYEDARKHRLPGESSQAYWKRMDEIESVVCFEHQASPSNSMSVSDMCPSLKAGTTPAVCFESRFVRNGRGAPSDVVPCLKAEAGGTGKGGAAPLVCGTISQQLGTGGYSPDMAETYQIAPAGVRRLTPRECERLQGFEDDWTRYLDDGREQADSARYRQCGNAVCRNVAEWLGMRVATALCRSILERG
jgi:site-specific DNA-cytosine methylase